MQRRLAQTQANLGALQTGDAEVVTTSDGPPCLLPQGLGLGFNRSREGVLPLNADTYLGILTGLPPECALLDSRGGHESAAIEHMVCAIKAISMNDARNPERSKC